MRDNNTKNKLDELAFCEANIKFPIQFCKHTLEQNKNQPTAKLTYPIEFFFCHLLRINKGMAATDHSLL